MTLSFSYTLKLLEKLFRKPCRHAALRHTTILHQCPNDYIRVRSSDYCEFLLEKKCQMALIACKIYVLHICKIGKIKWIWTNKKDICNGVAVAFELFISCLLDLCQYIQWTQFIIVILLQLRIIISISFFNCSRLFYFLVSVNKNILVDFHFYWASDINILLMNSLSIWTFLPYQTRFSRKKL